MRNYTPDPRLYELVTILSPEVSEEDLPAQVDAIAGYVTTAGGSVDEVLRESPWGRRRLAYTVRHAGRDLRDGYYTVFHITLDPGGVRDIERDLKLNDQVIRFLITHYTPKPVQPGQQPDGGDPSTRSAESASAADSPTPDSPDATATTAAPAAARSEVPESVTDAPVAADTPELEAPVDESTAESAVEPAVDTAAEETPETTASDSGTEASESSAPVEPTASNETALETEVAADPEPEPADTSEGTDTPVEAEAAPAEPTAPAKDTEEA